MDVDESFTEYVSARWSTLYRLAVLLVGPTHAGDLLRTALVRTHVSWRTVQAESRDDYVKKILANAALTGSAADSGVLPPRQRAVIVLTYYEDLSEAEIARTLGCSRETVRADATAALATLTTRRSAELRAELERTAGEAVVPMAPIEAMLSSGHQARRARTRRRMTVSAAVIAAVVGTAVIVSSLDGPSSSDRPSPPAGSSASTLPGVVPKALADLPRGEAPKRAYVTGKTLHLPNGDVALESNVDTVLQAGSSVILRYRDRKIVRVDTASHHIDVLAESSPGRPVIDPGGHQVAWQTSRNGQARVTVRALDGTPGAATRTFPAAPTCCDNPFLVNGITQAGQLIASLPSEGTAWVWDTHADRLREIRGLGGRLITQVTANEIVVQAASSAGFVAGTVTDGALEETQRIDGQAADFADPSGRRIVYTVDGDVHVRDRGPGVTAPNILYRDIVLHLPGLANAPDLYWEDGDHVLLDASEDGMGAGWLVRCDVGTRACETAVRFDGSHLVAQ
jgi:DNA-binding CsgD family transcriptional regulator